MSKGIAIRTVMLLLVGIVVIGILSYLLYRYYFTTAGQMSTHECRVRLTEVCTQCVLSGFVEIDIGSTLTTECGQYDEFSGWAGITRCDNTTTRDLCKLIGVT